MTKYDALTLLATSSGGSSATETRRPPRNLKNETPNYLEREAVCALAGIAADRVLNGRLTFGSAMGDVPHVRRIADRLGVADVEGFLRHKLRTAEEFVVLNREVVEEVARLLIERRTLPGYEVRRIVMTQGNPAPLGDSNRGQPRT